MNIKTPINWRKGQTVFNFLEWLQVNKHAPSSQSPRMADPFHMSDEKFDELYDKFLKENEPNI